MSIVKKQTYDNTYFFSDKGEMNRHHKEIVKFIMDSTRIDNKSTDAFAGVVNDVKRNQTSSILYTLLMRPDIVLCIANTEMPRAFKVFSAKDMKTDGTPKVFIDVTNCKLEDGTEDWDAETPLVRNALGPVLNAVYL